MKQQPPNGMMSPWAMWMPPWQQPQQQPGGQNIAPEVIMPPRVNKGLEFVELMIFKGMARAATNDLNIEVIPGQRLTDEEENALATACQMLSAYFAGKLAPDVWENLRVKALMKMSAQNETPGRVLDCFSCTAPGRQPHRDCPLCSGTGLILVTPLSSQIAAQDGGDETPADIHLDNPPDNPTAKKRRPKPNNS